MGELMHCCFLDLLCLSTNVDIGMPVEYKSKPLLLYLYVNVKLAQAVRTAKLILFFNCL